MKGWLGSLKIYDAVSSQHVHRGHIELLLGVGSCTPWTSQSTRNGTGWLADTEKAYGGTCMQLLANAGSYVPRLPDGICPRPRHRSPALGRRPPAAGAGCIPRLHQLPHWSRVALPAVLCLSGALLWYNVPALVKAECAPRGTSSRQLCCDVEACNRP